MKPAYLTTLTSLRGIAAILVVFFHFHIFVAPLTNPADSEMIRHLYLMVDFFFILSGFVMGYVYGDWFRTGVIKASFMRYMGARFARIYPLHLLTFLWVFGLYVWIINAGVKLQGGAEMVFSLPDVPLHLLLLNGFNQAVTATWNTPSWSIGSEWLMYLLFPFMVPLFSRSSLRVKAALLLVPLSGYILLTYLQPPMPDYKEWLKTLPYNFDAITFPKSFIRCFCGFLTGMICLDAYRERWMYSLLGNGMVLAAIGTGVLICWHLNVPDGLTIWTFPLLIIGTAYNQGQLARLLNTRVFQRLGDWSFSIYMVHIPIVFTFLAVDLISKVHVKNPPAPRGVHYGIDNLITCLVFVAIVLVVASLTYRFVEVPARKRLNAVLDREKQQYAFK